MAKEIDIVTAAIASAMAGSGGGGGAVQSVNGQTGAVVLNAEDVGALPDDTDIPTALADLSEDAEHRTVTDTQTAQWDAKQDAIPDETYDDYGAAAEVQTNLDAVAAKIPSAASTSNQLADKSYVNSALAEKQDIIPANTYDAYGAADAAETAANTYTDGEIADVQSQIDALVSKSDVVDVVGTYTELQNYDTTTLLDNDVVKVLSDSTHSDSRSYYRWIITDDVGAWSYIGSEAVGYTKSETDTLLNAKQNTISDLVTIRSGAALGATAVQPVSGKGLSTNDYTTEEKNKLAGIAAGATAVSETTVSGWGFTKNPGTYSKPSDGIPKTDLASAVQTLLDKADAAYTKPSDGIPKTDLASDVQSALDAGVDATARLAGTGAPTTATVGRVGDLYTDTSTGKGYRCTAVSGSTYTWEELGAGGDGSLPIAFSDKTVAVSAWTADTTFTDYPYKADITCTGVTANMFADAVFSPTDSTSGNLATVCTTGTNIVTIYAKTIPAAAVLVLTIIAWEVAE